MNIEVGMYVRIKNRGIAKFRGWNAYDENKVAIHTHNEGDIEITPVIDKNTIIKASYNIIDILEVGDYVNGHRVEEINFENEEIFTDSEYYCGIVEFSNVKSVITHEQMEQMAYKVVE